MGLRGINNCKELIYESMVDKLSQLCTRLIAGNIELYTLGKKFNNILVVICNSNLCKF